MTVVKIETGRPMLVHVVGWSDRIGVFHAEFDPVLLVFPAASRAMEGVDA